MSKWIYSPVSILAAVLVFTAYVSPTIAQDRSKTDLAKSVVGTWRIVSYTALDLATKDVSYPQGQHPIGYLQYSPNGHMAGFMSDGEMSKANPPFTDADKVTFYNALVAYCGTYTVQGSTVTHHVIAAYRPDWVGSDQVRHVQLHGNTLTIKTAPVILAATGKKVVATLIWEREQ